MFWFRRDLRLEDNAGLYHALKKGIPYSRSLFLILTSWVNWTTKQISVLPSFTKRWSGYRSSL
ncbi:deoxyribodipyrimidine photo-lyase [Niabella sp. W65]|nr:deoxyribodipyrimidine photo-lyase [Niabella sp. W65]MCH7362355.1 deoxyribodipyrimidine photo-lyase [Niabella sp. W65]